MIFVLVFPSLVSAFGEFTIKDEAELGQKFNTLIQSRFDLIHDPEIVNYARDMVARIAAVMPAQPFPIQVHVVDQAGLNAFAVPAGYVYIFSGLILGVDNESELAGVVAHEMAHVSQRHIAKNIERSRLINIGALLGMLAGAFLAKGEGAEALAMGSLAGAQSMMLKYSREHEEEADQIGIQYLTRAGYPAQGMVGAFRKIRQKHRLSQGSFPSYLSTHPGVDERIGYLESRVENLPAAMQGREDVNERLRRVQTLLRAKHTDPKSALIHFSANPGAMSCLDHLGAAIARDRLHQIKEAESHYEAGLACAGDDSLWLRESGRFFFESGRFERAAGLLQKAVIKSPRDVVALFYLARVQAGTGELAGAVESMRRVLRLQPENSDAHYHLGRILGEQGELFHAYLHLAYAAIYDNQAKQARLHVANAERLADTMDKEALYQELEGIYHERREFWEDSKS